MPAPQLPTNVSLETTRDDLVFSRTRCTVDPKAADQVPVFAALLAKWNDVNQAQLGCWDAQTMADALIAAADDTLDVLVERFSVALLAVVGQKRNHKHYQLYFDIPPNELKRPVLGAQLETIRGWLALLATETDATIVAFAAQFQAAVQQADAAIAARLKADTGNDEFRAKGGLATYLSEVQTARDTVFATLDGRPAKDPALARGWASGFFRARKAAAPSAAEKVAKAEKKAAEKALATGKKTAVAAAKAKVKEAQRMLKELGK